MMMTGDYTTNTAATTTTTTTAISTMHFNTSIFYKHDMNLKPHWKHYHNLHAYGDITLFKSSLNDHGKSSDKTTHNE
jgi:hypothetical protein